MIRLIVKLSIYLESSWSESLASSEEIVVDLIIIIIIIIMKKYILNWKKRKRNLPNRRFCFRFWIFQENPTSFSFRFFGFVMITPFQTSPESPSLISVGLATNSWCFVFFKDLGLELFLNRLIKSGN